MRIKPKTIGTLDFGTLFFPDQQSSHPLILLRFTFVNNEYIAYDPVNHSEVPYTIGTIVWPLPPITAADYTLLNLGEPDA